MSSRRALSGLARAAGGRASRREQRLAPMVSAAGGTRVEAFTRGLQWMSTSRVCDWLPGKAGGGSAGVVEQRRGVASASKDEMIFHKVADETLNNLQDVVEAWGEDNAGEDFDLSHEMGVVTIAVGSGKGTYVINKQAPNRQIWVSSPVSGPLRYDYDPKQKAWIYHRDGHALHERLREELLGMFGGDLDLNGLNE